MGNPPTGIAGGYCVLDVLSLRIGALITGRRECQGALGGVGAVDGAAGGLAAVTDAPVISVTGV